MTPVLLLLQHTWRLYTRNLSIFLGYMAWILVAYACTISLDWLPPSTLTQIVQGVFEFLQLILVIWASAVTMLVTSAIVHEENVDLTRVGSIAWKKVPHLAWVGILGALIVIGGLILVVIPGLVFMIWYTFGQAEVVLQDTRGWDALQASRRMVEGRFWATALRVVAGPLFLFLGYAFAAGLLIALFAFISGTPETAFVVSESPIWQDVVSTVVETLSLPLFVIYSTLLYLEARQSPASPTV